MSKSPKVVGIVSTYNEEDIVAEMLEHLSGQEIFAYLLDDGSTDKTVEAARPFLGRNLLAIETLEKAPEDRARTFSLSRILTRKEELAGALQADWFINQDADEFRESPWPHLSLREAIGLVDRLGWNAIDFDVLEFRPIKAGPRDGSLHGTFHYFQHGAAYDRRQVRCWKKGAARVDLAGNAGHDVQFADRRVFPIRFPMRHYPIRDDEHGARKVFEERRPRFDPAERARGWHVQYDRIAEGDGFVRDPASLTLYDRDVVNVGLQLDNVLVEESRAEVKHLTEALSATRSALDASEGSRSNLERQLHEVRSDAARERVKAETERESLRLQTEALERGLGEERAHCDRLHAEADRERQRGEVLEREVAEQRIRHDRLQADATSVARRLDEVLASRSWRITAPLRAIWEWVFVRR